MLTQPRSKDQFGSGVWLVIAVIAVASVILMGGTQLAISVVSSARARTTADAAALAATTDQTAAQRIVTEAGGELRSITRQGQVVVVVVDVAGQRALAAATKPPSVGGTGDRAGLAPAMLAALARADDLLGQVVPVVSGYRSPAHQQLLWDRRAGNIYPVARPGTSKHEAGLAVDVPLIFVQTLKAVAAFSGLCHPLPDTDPVHFVVCPNLR
ncbi:MAG: hypothetical protein GXP35_16465 [Actinobacteria bacterium]|nr:hypothetical protein [Actinomycetota bacterium]